MQHPYALAARAAHSLRLALAGYALTLLALLPGAAQAQTITSFTPTSGPIGTSVTITGTGFGATAAQNAVFFGATRAAVTGASSTSLTVSVPLGATYQYPTVTNLASARTASASQPFVVTLNGAVAFAPKADAATGATPTSVTMGDVDGDGKPDLVVANYDDATVSVLRNTGAAGTVSFAAKVDLATGVNPRAVAMGDVDGDGKPDLVVANYGSNTVSVLRNLSTSGALSFAAKVDFATGLNPRAVAIGDVDGDGKPDLVTANFSSNTISVLRNTGVAGTVSFAAKVDYATGAVPRSVAIGDVDGNGKPDVVTANLSDNTVSVLRNLSTTGTVAFAAKADFATGTGPFSVAMGDVDGDGKPDLAATNADDNTLSVLRNLSTAGTVSFAAKVDYATGASPWSVAMGDVDGDGKPDVVTTNLSDNTVSVLRNTGVAGTLSFAPKVDFATSGNPYSVALGDVDGDGKPDLAVANELSNSVSVLRQVVPAPTITSLTPTSGPIGTSVTITGTGFGATAAQNVVFFGATRAAVTGASPTSLTVSVPLGTTFQYPTVTNLISSLTAYAPQPFVVTLNGSVAFAPKADFLTSLNPYSVAIGDVDGDGKPDLVTADEVSNSVSVLRNTGAAGAVAFAPKVDFATSGNPNLVALADVDGDGRLDLVTANYGSNTVSVLRNIGVAGAVVFASKVDFATGSLPVSVAIGDVDGDGKPDLVVANSGSNVVSVLRNLSTVGTVVFAPRVGFSAISQLYSVAVGDVDGDGKPDIVVANGGSNAVSVLRNTCAAGTLSFAAKADFATGAGPYSVVIGDVDGDGKPDLATANQGGNTVSVLRNTGAAGTVAFAAKVDYATGSLPTSVAIGDVDGDGKPDLAVADLSSNTVSVLRNLSTSGTVSFAAKVDFATGSFTRSVAIGDMDGDGKPDLVTANEVSNSVSVLRQLTPIITSFTPTSGPIGTSVTITGTSLSGASSVSFNGTAQTTITANTSTSLTVVVPAGATTGTLTVTTPGGTSAASSQAFTVVPTITSFTPTSGPIGTSVTITGTGFGATAAQNVVFFGATRAAVTGASPTSLTVSVPLGATYQYPTVTNLASARTASALQPFVVTLNGAVVFAPKADAATGSLPYAVAMGDVDGDGKPDLVVANYSDFTVSVLRNTGTAGTVSFAAKVDFATDALPGSVAIGDVDGDGKPDIVVTNSADNSVSVLRNLSTSGVVSFAAKIGFFTGSAPSSVAIGDVDGDGRPDLAVANEASNTVSVLRNTGTAGTVSFGAKVDFATGSTPGSVAIGDVDGDGKLDLVTANTFGNNTVSVLRNLSTAGTVAFAAKVDFFTGLNPRSVAIGDIDGDGKPDLAVANGAASTVSVLRNLSTAGVVSFAANADFATGLGPHSVAIGDVDGDGKPDLATANSGTSTVSVLRNTSAAGVVSFATKVDLGTGVGPYSVAIGDVDGDGKPDLATANESSNTFSVLRQVAPVPTITNLTPTSGPIGTSVTITGTGFTGATGVSFNGTAATTFSVTSATTATATVPTGATTGNVTITTPGGTSNGVSFTVITDLVVSTGTLASPTVVAAGSYNTILVTGTGVGQLSGSTAVTTSVTVNGTLLTACQALTGPGSFVLAAGGTLGICDANGIAASGNTGAIQTASRSFAPAATYVYNGTGAQVTGTGLPATVETLEVNATGPVQLTQALTLSRELRLTRGTFNLNGQGLTLLSNATATAQVNQDGVTTTGSVTGGSATVQRFVPANGNAGPGYRHFASPVSGNTLADLAVPGGFTPLFNSAYNGSAGSALITPFPTVFGFDPARVATATSSYTGFDQGWYSPATGTTPDAFTPGRGYSVNLAANQTPDFVGPLNQVAVPVAMTRAAGTAAPDDNKGWHLLGNPFASSFALAALDNTPGVDNAKYVFQSTGPYAGGYDTYLTGTSGQPLLALGQGFFARTSAPNTSPTLTFALSGRRVDFTTSSAFHRSTAGTRPLLELALANAAGTLRDRTLLYADASATPGLDPAYDAVKLPNPHGLNLAQQAAGASLAVNGLPAFATTTVVPLTVGVPAAGTYSLQVNQLENLPAGTAVVLVDALLNARTDLATLPAAGYVFTLTSAQAATLVTGRFFLNLTAATALATATGQTARPLQLFPNPARTAAMLTGALPGTPVQLFDALGRQVLAATADAAGSVTLALPAGLAAGVYVVRAGTSALRLTVE